MGTPAEKLQQFAFSDGQYLAHFADGDTCVMNYRNWQEQVFRFVFTGVALVRAFGGAVSLCDGTVSTDSPLIDDARRVLANDWGTNGGPKSVALTDLTITDDVPVFSVVFTDVRVDGPLSDDDLLKW